MFEVTAIQAEIGDCLLVRYGQEPEVHNLLIDGGTTATKDNLLSVLSRHKNDGPVRLTALAVTHYDTDHINGIIELLRDKPDWLDICDIWFNGHDHVLRSDLLGTKEADELSSLIEGKFGWNKAFGEGTVKFKAGRPAIHLAGMEVWVLSPDQLRLANLAAAWPAGTPSPPDETGSARRSDILGAKDTWPPGPFTSVAGTLFREDKAVTNGSSIALMLKYDGKYVLLMGDAYPSVVTTAIKTYWPGQRPEVALMKLSHHGSKANTSEELLKSINCRRFLISTNGSSSAKHPDNALIARVIKNAARPKIIFNYPVDRNKNWESRPDGWPAYETAYPNEGDPFVCVDVMDDQSPQGLR